MPDLSLDPLVYPVSCPFMSTHLTTTLPTTITSFISSASREQKQLLLSLLTKDLESDATTTELSKAESEPEPKPKSNSPTTVDKVPQISDYMEHISELDISEDLSAEVLKELEGLKLRTRGTKGRPAKVKTQWLSPSNESYNYGKIVNKPKAIRDFPRILEVMDIVNKHPSTSGDMTACLVSCMSTMKSNLSYHADDEEDLIAQDSDICTVSFGPARTLDFVWNTTNPRGRRGPPPSADYSVPATNHSLNIMKAGCQQMLQHRVPPGEEAGVRYSLSFRRIVVSKPPSPEPSGHSPGQTCNTTSSVNDTPLKSKNKKKIVLLAGDSYFERLDEKKLGKGKQDVYKVAKGGRKIVAVQQAIESFVQDHPDLEIKSLFVSIGTNDIRNCKQGIGHLKAPVCEFMKRIKLMAPTAKIFIQSLLPIPANGNPKGEKNVLSMNNLLYDLCSRYKLFYLDVFGSFLNEYGNSNLSLFPAYDKVRQSGDIHPNAKGMGVLARHYIYLIHSKWFNPLGY